MTLAADDRGLRIVLTCRDYSVEQVRASFLQPHRINHTVTRVPPLDDAELTEAEAAYPALAIPLKSPDCRTSFATPSFSTRRWISVVLREIPSADRARIPRTLLARNRARRPSCRARHGTAARRGAETIAVRRARALSAHVPATGLDAAVVKSLRGDSLITSSDDHPLLVATAHDVLEDWAILQWLEEQHLSEASFETLSDAIGTHPPCGALIASGWPNSSSAMPLPPTACSAAVSETRISVQFRDDTLVAAQGAVAPDFLARDQAQLLANGRTLLERVIHLLRVACVKTPDWLAGLVGQGSILNVPDGSHGQRCCGSFIAISRRSRTTTERSCSDLWRTRCVV